MSFSKTLPSYRKCTCINRSASTKSTNPDYPLSSRFKMPLGYQMKNFSSTNWKLLNHLKEYLTKSPFDKSVMFVLGKEWISILQKMPQITGVKGDSHFAKQHVKKISSTTTSTVKPENNHTVTSVTAIPQTAAVTPKESYSLPQVIEDIKLKLSSKTSVPELPEGRVPRWKTKTDSNLSKHKINAQTRQYLTLVENAENTASRLKRLESLTAHLYSYPGTTAFAVKEGAVRMLLRIRQVTKDEETLSELRQAFALLGHVDPPTGWGIRILSIDGGGMRGVVVLEMLKKLEQLTGQRTYELFDYICGVSTGAIMMSSIGCKSGKTLEEVQHIYKEMSIKVFSQNAFWGTSNLVWSHAYYDTTMWEDLLKNYVGDRTMLSTTRASIAPKMSAVSAIVNQTRVQPYLFRNYSLPYQRRSQYLGSSRHTLFEAVRASAAAPTIFEEFRIGELIHQDGGILVNNPTALAIHEAKQLWPNSPIQCVVSFGTGRHNPSFRPTENMSATATSWKKKFDKILDSATDTEAVHTVLNDLLSGNVYYRFNPYLTEIVAMDEKRSDKIFQLETDTLMYYRRNEEKFHEAANALMQTRTRKQRIRDYITLQALLLGVF